MIWILKTGTEKRFYRKYKHASGWVVYSISVRYLTAGKKEDDTL